MLQKWESIVLEACLRIFIGIPSGPVAFLGSKDLMIEFISFTVGSGKSKGFEVVKLFLILIMLGWFW